VAWEETRGTSRVVLADARQVAHADDVKGRSDEASRLPARSLRPRVLVGAGAGLVVLALVAFLLLRGGDKTTDRAALVDAPPTPTSSATGPSPAAVLEESAPTGVWKVVVVGRTLTTRGGQTRPLRQREDPVLWTFPAVACSDTQCSGTLSSSSGKDFSFTWDGRTLAVAREDSVYRNKKEACVDTETGVVQPIEESAARITWHYHYSDFVGSSSRLVGSSVTRTTYEFFGTCEPHDSDTVKATYEWRMTPVEKT
jgi:hypothetical protein